MKNRALKAPKKIRGVSRPQKKASERVISNTRKFFSIAIKGDLSEIEAIEACSHLNQINDLFCGRGIKMSKASNGQRLLEIKGELGSLDLQRAEKEIKESLDRLAEGKGRMGRKRRKNTKLKPSIKKSLTVEVEKEIGDKVYSYLTERNDLISSRRLLMIPNRRNKDVWVIRLEGGLEALDINRAEKLILEAIQNARNKVSGILKKAS